MHRNNRFLKNNFRDIFLLSTLIGLFFLFFPVTNTFGRDISFSWTENSDDPPVEGYRLYYKIGDPGSSLSNYNGTDADTGNPSPIDIPSQITTSYTLLNLLDSEKYSFVLTAYRDLAESDPTGAITLEALSPDTSNLNANIGAAPLTGDIPLLVTFDATSSTGNIESYAWMFGDGQTGVGSTPSHTFSTEGNYTVTLIVTDTLGSTDQATLSIVTTNPSETNNPPSAIISASSTVGTTPLTIEFDGSLSTDNDGSILSHVWDFGDGNSTSGATVNYTYMTAGTFNARLTVTDNGGLTDTTTMPVILTEPSADTNILPVAVISSSSNRGYVPLNVSFDAGQSYDPDGSIENYTWSFGDGTTASGVNVSRKFMQPAVYKITLKVKDDQGASSHLATFTVTALDPDQDNDSILKVPLSIINFLLLNQPLNEAMTEED